MYVDNPRALSFPPQVTCCSSGVRTLTGVALLALVALFLAPISRLDGEFFRPQQLGVGRGEISCLTQQLGVGRSLDFLR